MASQSGQRRGNTPGSGPGQRKSMRKPPDARRRMDGNHAERLARLLPEEAVGSPAERRRWALLVDLLASAAPPPDPDREFPDFSERQERLRAAIAAGYGEEVEQAFLELYAHLHGHEARYARGERRVVDESGGYWAHAGGLGPILKAPDWLGPASTSIDYGAGNGLQGLLMQLLAPHRLTVQVEISSRAAETGRRLQTWLGIEPQRVAWWVEDVRNAVRHHEGYDLVYLYRPVRPDGPARRFYEDLAAKLDGARHPVTVLSIADALGPFLPDGFEVVHSDGHLTCFHRPSPA